MTALSDFESPGPAVETARRPKYQRIREHLFAEINSGRYAPGQSLPTEAKLAEMLGISRNTIRQALGELEGDGIVKRVQGRGTFVTNPQERKALHQMDAFALISPQLREGFYPSLVAGFEQASAGIQCQALVGSSANDLSKQGDLILQMIDKRVAGVALVPVAVAATPLHHIRQLHEHHIPVVFCHRAVEGVNAPCVGWDGEKVGQTAGKCFMIGDTGAWQHCLAMKTRWYDSLFVDSAPRFMTTNKRSCRPAGCATMVATCLDRRCWVWCEAISLNCSANLIARRPCFVVTKSTPNKSIWSRSSWECKSRETFPSSISAVNGGMARWPSDWPASPSMSMKSECEPDNCCVKCEPESGP